MQAEADNRELKHKVEDARKKKAAFGEDIDLDKYPEASKDIPKVDSLTDLSNDEQRTLLNAGVVYMDETVVHTSVKMPGVEVMPVSEALKKYDWMRDYYWKAVLPDADKYTARTFEEQADGYFIRALPGAKVKAPVQTCLMLKGKSVAQTVHNVIIVEGRNGGGHGMLDQQRSGEGAPPWHQRVLPQEGGVADLHHDPQLVRADRGEAQNGHPAGGGLDVHQQLRGAQAGADHPNLSNSEIGRQELLRPVQYRGNRAPWL
jgi:hypothetical protein